MMQLAVHTRPSRIVAPTSLWLALAMLAALLPGRTTPQALAAAAPVHYDAASNTIYIGEDYADPALAAYPSAPGAPKTPITIPQVAAALTTQGLLVDQGAGAWLLKANVVVSPTARLEATNASISWLRLDSTPNRAPGYISLTASGGHILIQNIAVTSWNTLAGTFDLDYADGRAYLLANSGGRMDVITAVVAYLGWASGGPSGMSWRGRATESRPETGATGSIVGSDIHHNYFGQYSYAAYGLRRARVEPEAILVDLDVEPERTRLIQAMVRDDRGVGPRFG
jgi:hypothetical protein